MGSAEPRLQFAIRHGIDTFLSIRECFETAPLIERPTYWDDLVLILWRRMASNWTQLSIFCKEQLENLLKEYRPFNDAHYNEKKSVAILPPGYDFCPLECRYQNGLKRALTLSQNEPTEATVFELDGTSRLVTVLKRVCRGCSCVLEYDMLYTTRGYQFYATPQRYIRVTPNVYFARDLCRHIVLALARGRQTFEGFAELWLESYKCTGGFDRKWVSTAFYRHEIETELRATSDLISTSFASYNSYDDILPYLESLRIQRNYPHVQSEYCLKYKCDNFDIPDGIWSINFPHCAAPVQTSVRGFPNINLPPICPNQPETDSLYCALHRNLVKETHQLFTQEQLASLRQEINSEDLAKVLRTPDEENFLTTITESHTEHISFNEVLPYRCSKDIGERAKKRKAPKTRSDLQRSPVELQLGKGVLRLTKCPRSRGLILNVRPCGHINSVVPIYKSESPSQVFLTIVTNLYNHVKESRIPASEWKKRFVIYDNICNLDRIQAARNLLPLPPPYDRLWLDHSKAIDVFHLRNHCRLECRTTYSPKNIKLIHPDLRKRNTEAAEQTNSWLKRFKAVLNSIPRNRHLFYLHRLVLHRNSYLADRNTNRNNENYPAFDYEIDPPSDTEDSASNSDND